MIPKSIFLVFLIYCDYRTVKVGLFIDSLKEYKMTNIIADQIQIELNKLKFFAKRLQHKLNIPRATALNLTAFFKLVVTIDRF